MRVLVLLTIVPKGRSRFRNLDGEVPTGGNGSSEMRYSRRASEDSPNGKGIQGSKKRGRPHVKKSIILVAVTKRSSRRPSMFARGIERRRVFRRPTVPNRTLVKNHQTLERSPPTISNRRTHSEKGT